MVEPQKPTAEVSVVPRGESWKNWTIAALAILSAGLLYYEIYYAKNIILTITGEQIVLLVLIACGIAYYLQWKYREIKLGDAFEVSHDCAEFYFKNYGKQIDWHNVEVRRKTQKTALVRFENNSLLFTYEAGIGVTEITGKDMDTELAFREKSELLSSYSKESLRRDAVEKILEERGFKADVD